MWSKRFLCTGSWRDKETGQPMATLCEITEGKSKLGNVYAIANTSKGERVNRDSFIGEIVAVQMMESGSGAGHKAPAKTAAPEASPKQTADSDSTLGDMMADVVKKTIKDGTMNLFT